MIDDDDIVGLDEDIDESDIFDALVLAGLGNLAVAYAGWEDEEYESTRESLSSEGRKWCRSASLRSLSSRLRGYTRSWR